MAALFKPKADLSLVDQPLRGRLLITLITRAVFANPIPLGDLPCSMTLSPQCLCAGSHASGRVIVSVPGDSPAPHPSVQLNRCTARRSRSGCRLRSASFCGAPDRRRRRGLVSHMDLLLLPCGDGGSPVLNGQHSKHFQWKRGVSLEASVLSRSAYQAESGRVECPLS